MSQLSQKTAILFFAYSVEKETYRKRLLSGQRNKDLLTALHQKSLQTLKASELPIFHFSEKDQRGETFGERISNAFEAVFNKGFENVVCVGNDCPELSLNDLRRTEEELESSEIVLGPDFRGGAFLIGLQKKAFNKCQMTALNWNRADLINSFIGYGISLNIHFLEAKYDLNFAAEIYHHAIHSTELQNLLTFIRKNEISYREISLKYDNRFSNAERLRGPPHAA